MRRKTSGPSAAGAALLLSLLTSQARAEVPLEGVWVGQWVRDGAALAVSMNFARTADGYAGSFDSEQLRVVGVPIRKLEYRPPAVRWRVVGDATTMTFEGELRGRELRGRFREGKAEGTFTLARSGREPGGPREQPVSFRNGDVNLAGTVVLPEGAGPFQGVVFLHGSGPEARWASRYLAGRFARRGIAALVYDKRGVGASTGDWQKAGFEELAGDAAAAVAALRAHPGVSPGGVGIHGHSQGGTIAPLVAGRVKDLAFVVASAAAGVPTDECEVFSLENSLRVRSLSPADGELARQFVQALVATAYRGAPRAELDAAARKVRNKPWAIPIPPAGAGYWSFSRRIAGYDPLAYWGQVSAPALLVYGEADERVPARRSAARIAGAYLGTRGSQMEARFFEGADHTFRLPPEHPGRFAWPQNAPGYPDAVVDWVARVTGAPARQ
jgi:pimeloyl-ACP methyl ester carboxylesterase